MNKYLKQLKVGNWILSLKCAKIFIEMEEEKYICNAIPGYGKHETYLREWINFQLDGCKTLEEWLVKKNYASASDFKKITKKTKLKLIRTRCLWIDWMIDELKKDLEQ